MTNADRSEAAGTDVASPPLNVLIAAGPGLMVIGWILLVANAGNGANDAWMVGHYILFVGNIAWVPLIWRVSQLPPDVGLIRRRLPALLGLVGSLAIAGQLAIDMVAWALALDRAELTTFFSAIRAKPCRRASTRGCRELPSRRPALPLSGRSWCSRARSRLSAT